MGLPIIYLDRSEVMPGRLGDLRRAFARLAATVREGEPGLLTYAVYLTADGSSVSVLHAHHDEASLARHMAVVAPHLAPFADLLRLREIEIFGDIGPELEETLNAKLRQLGHGRLTLNRPATGFLRQALG